MDLHKKIQLIEQYDDAYYNNEAIVSDEVYDALKKDLMDNLPEDHPLKLKVGHSVKRGWDKISHEQFMGSQNKVCTEDEIRVWISNIKKKIGSNNLTFVVQYKIDGFSLGCYYKKGVLKVSATRGDGHIGEDITRNAIHFKDIVHTLPIEKNIAVRGESVIDKEWFERLQKITSNSYKNARNAASGISRRLDGKFSAYIKFIAFDVNAKVSTEIQKIETLNKLKFKTVPSFFCKNEEQVISLYKKVKDHDRAQLPYTIDGLVLKINEVAYQEMLGIDRGRPAYQIAMKFDPIGATSEIIDIILQVGRTGKITPVAIITPTLIDGSLINRLSVHNFDYIEKEGVGNGASVVISKRGDIIPQIEHVISPGNPFILPEVCPSCGGSLEHDGVNIWCHNDVCKERDINRIVYWIQTLDMKGFSEKFVERLWDLGKIRSISDLYNLTADDFIAVEGIGEKTVKAFFKTMKETSSLYLTKFITALGIPTCSKSTAEILVERYGTWDKIASIKPSDLEKISGFAEISAGAVCEGIAEVRDMAEDLLKVIKILEVKKGVLTGMSFCVTGSLTSMGRKEFQKIVVDNGGIAKDSVSDGLTYLVTNGNNISGKMKKAKKLNITIIDESTFLKMIPIKKNEKLDIVPDNNPNDIKIVTESLF